MKTTRYEQTPILVIGADKLIGSILVCLLKAGHRLTLFSDDCEAVRERMKTHLAATGGQDFQCREVAGWEAVSSLTDLKNYRLAVAVTPENKAEKIDLLQRLETVLSDDALVAINTESIPLDTLQREVVNPGRIIGLNWADPAHTTYFLEVITTNKNPPALVEPFLALARTAWGKDPYLLRHGLGIRTRMLCAMVREAFFLVENGYVSVEDVDRGCRNDAGYYLPFAGNFRYMDLMGTYIYGLVMQDLNPQLSKDRHLPEFFTDIIRQGGQGMENKKGFYTYGDGEAEKWDKLLGQFSYQIAQLIDKYPFKPQEITEVTDKPSLVHD